MWRVRAVRTALTFDLCGMAYKVLPVPSCASRLVSESTRAAVARCMLGGNLAHTPCCAGRSHVVGADTAGGCQTRWLLEMQVWKCWRCCIVGLASHWFPPVVAVPLACHVTIEYPGWCLRISSSTRWIPTFVSVVRIAFYSSLPPHLASSYYTLSAINTNIRINEAEQ